MCVDMGGGGSHFRGKGGSQGVHEGGGVHMGFTKRGVHRGFTKRGVHVNPMNPPGYGPAVKQSSLLDRLFTDLYTYKLNSSVNSNRDTGIHRQRIHLRWGDITNWMAFRFVLRILYYWQW